MQSTSISRIWLVKAIENLEKSRYSDKEQMKKNVDLNCLSSIGKFESYYKKDIRFNKKKKNNRRVTEITQRNPNKNTQKIQSSNVHIQ